MASTPQFVGPDGVLREESIFSTTIQSRFFTGTMDADTVDMQVSIRGGGFTSDPDYITFEGTQYTIPNPSAFPDGLLLLPGDNDIQVKSVLSNGEVTPSGTVLSILSTDKDIRGVAFAPSGLYIERFDSTVSITVEGIDDTGVQGYHYYASTQPGGGTVGYSRINPTLVISGESVEVKGSLGALQVDSAVATTPSGDPAADPLFMVISAEQQDQQRTTIQADFSEALEVTEGVTQIRTSVLVESVRSVQRYSFVHDRLSTFDSSENPAIPNADFNTILRSEPLYYVISAVWLIDGDEFESDFSPEVLGAPLVLTPSVGTFPTVTRQQMVRDVSLSIFRSHPEVDFKPGSSTRDLFIDPFTTEAERIRFIVDFVHNAQSFTTLLLIDDPGNSGDSIDVSQSNYKLALRSAFHLEDNASVQTLIDNGFDKLASNHGETRKGGTRSRGEVTISLDSRPTYTIQYPIGQQVSGNGVFFRLTSSAQITPSGAGAFFNPATGKYSSRAFIQAESPGGDGDMSPGLVNVIHNGPPVKATITNQSRTFGGRDEETNRELATRVTRKLAGTDSGRYQGYVDVATKVPGVLQANIVDPGHPLMQRDKNAAGTHVGGKVDVWIRGESLGTVTDNFAFTFEIKENVQFEIVGDPGDLIFRAVDPDLSDDNPIIEMMDFETAGFVFKNGTTLHEYDLTDVTILRPDGIQLDSSLAKNAVEGSLSDVFFGSYRYRSSNQHVFTRQPVSEILSFEGDPDRSGVISPAFYELFHPSDPLDLGRSFEAGDYVQVIQDLDTDPLDIPSSDPIVVTDEQHVILDGVEYLNFLGVNPVTVQVFSADRATEYLSPYIDASPDYTLIDEDGPNPLGILLTSTSAIAEGESVLVDYQHDENFVVTFQTNGLVAITQESIDTFRHLTADSITKEAIPVAVDLAGTIVLRNKARSDEADSAVRTALSRLFGTFVLGEPIRQSDILNVLDTVAEVSYVVTPLTKMVRGDDVTVVREKVSTDQDADWTMLAAWSTPTLTTYLLDNPLDSATSDGGGAFNEFRGVFADEDLLLGFDIRPNINGVPLKNQPAASFIVGNTGIVIPGFSDDATLEANYVFDTDVDTKNRQIDDKRVELTANRVLVSLLPDQTPTDFEYTVTYLVSGDTGAKNIEPGPTEYLVLGDLDFVFDEDFDFTARVTGRVR